MLTCMIAGSQKLLVKWEGGGGDESNKITIQCSNQIQPR